MSYSGHQSRPIVFGTNGMASTGSPLATLTAIRVLERGGNAIDAAVAASAVLCVIDPASSGVGGEVFYTYFDSKTGQLDSLAGSGRSPRSATSDKFSNGVPAYGPLSPTVPGIVQGWEDVLKRHGTRSLSALLEPAIEYARNGFPVPVRLAQAFRRKDRFLSECEAAKECYQLRGEWPVAGQVLKLLDLADSLEAIAKEGATTFYRGDLSRRILSGLDAAGGLLDSKDFSDYVSAFASPLTVQYRDYEVAVPELPTMGAVLLQQLALLEELSPSVPEWNSATWQHLLIEIKKASFADLDTYLTDPSFSPREATQFLSEAYIKARAKAISSEKAALYEPGNLSAGLRNTVSLAVADRDGNVFSWIQSVFSEFGSCWMAPKTGILLNNRMFGFSSTKGHVNVIEPSKRTAHTLHCPIVLKQKRPILALSTPGVSVVR